MTLKKYDIWAEGFCDQGMEGIPEKARFVGTSEGVDFADACERWYKANVPESEFKRFFHLHNGKPYYYVRLFDNEKEAREAFG